MGHTTQFGNQISFPVYPSNENRSLTLGLTLLGADLHLRQVSPQGNGRRNRGIWSGYKKWEWTQF